MHSNSGFIPQLRILDGATGVSPGTKVFRQFSPTWTWRVPREPYRAVLES